MKTALIAGSTGLVGHHLLRLLLQHPQYERIISIGRRETGITDKKLDELILADFEGIQDHVDALKADHVFCCLGTTMKQAGSREAFYRVDFTYPMMLAKIALDNQSQLFSLISSIGADERSMFYYSRVKGKIESAVSDLGLHQVNIFRPSLLLGKRKKKRFGEDAGAAISKLFNPFLFKKYRAITAEDVARAIISTSSVEKPGVNIYESDLIREQALLYNSK